MQITINSDLNELIKASLTVSRLKHLGIKTVGDLLQYYPRKLEPPAVFAKTIRELWKLVNLNSNQVVCITGEISQIKKQPMRLKSGTKVEFIIKDSESREISANFFSKNFRYTNFLTNGFEAGQKVAIVGKPTIRESVQFVHPKIIKIENNEQELIESFLRPNPVYKASAKISSEKIHKTILEVIKKLEGIGASEVKDEWADDSESKTLVLPTLLPEKNDSTVRWNFLKEIHQPSSISSFEEAKEQLIFDEALVLQTVLAIRKLNIKNLLANPYPKDSRGMREKLFKNLPFSLTNSQIDCLEEISKDLSSPIPMRRLLQGDVGSGKTVVAVLSALQVIDYGAQTVLIVPTTVLANEHFQNISKLISNQGFDELILFTKNEQDKKRKLELIKNGTAKLIIGTSALLQSQVEFKDLGLVIIDEQHRFGVEQRDLLTKRNDSKYAHLLLLSATPIPRTVAMSIFGDLEISRINELPKNRKTVKTFIIEQTNQKLYNRVFEKVKELTEQNERVFFVVPRIDNSKESPEEEISLEVDKNSHISSLINELSNSLEPIETENLNLTTITKAKSIIKKNESTKNINISVLTGRSLDSEKIEELEKFKNGKNPILLSTTVIEVGIDIPEASGLVVFDADCFGLSTLHQLRGRVGRNNKESFCFLIKNENATEDGNKRLEILEKNTDGFEIAKQDLIMRGIGDVAGAKQSGAKNSLKLLNILEHSEIIEKAKRTAEEVIKNDIDLEKHLELKLAVQKELGAEQKEFLTKV